MFKTKYQISIPEPCNEGWNNMTPTKKGRFCANCKKEVIDFTNQSDFYLAQAIQADTNLCGRFRPNQLNRIISQPANKSFGKAGVFFGLLSFLSVSQPLFSQEPKPKVEKREQDSLKAELEGKQDSTSKRIIKGIVISEVDSLSLPGVNVILKGTGIGTQTDFDGNFNIEIPNQYFQDNIILHFTFVGMKEKEVAINKNDQEINVQLIEDPDLVSTGIVVTEYRRNNIFRRIGNLFRKK
ncbi:carboxypeptidase-like regulatory domain-containing protein [Mangrovimonas aestuarii]|uniref:carboxypeptidase-like regulatory domain-containing protein n=1 Tax=Mangrovimonas aestuarii TaxID=3018443 RepID=UPI0023787162|nr:carboxypeptidase-like regulatory domain-containing protein [Mangrovimonas aestuarii]